MSRQGKPLANLSEKNVRVSNCLYQSFKKAFVSCQIAFVSCQITWEIRKPDVHPTIYLSLHSLHSFPILRTDFCSGPAVGLLRFLDQIYCVIDGSFFFSAKLPARWLQMPCNRFPSAIFFDDRFFEADLNVSSIGRLIKA